MGYELAGSLGEAASTPQVDTAWFDGGTIDRHRDEGKYAEHYQRFHIVLASEDGNVFQCGNQLQWMRPATAWWFDHRQEHDVTNGSNASRVHLIVDLVSPSFVAGK